MTIETDLAEIGNRITQRFQVLERVAQGVVAGHIRGLIVSGAAGVGKTHTLETALTAAEVQGKVRYQSVRGSMSSIGLYKQLFEASEPGNVLLIDDCDSIFGDLDALNLLKTALDTGGTRRIHWAKESRVLDQEGIPNSFEFKGSVVFITNIDFISEIAAEKKMSPHYSALLSRCLYVDLAIHNRREVLVRIGQVVFSTAFLANNGLTEAQAADMMQWLSTNLNRVISLSIRTIIQLASLVKTSRNDWEMMANNTMVRG